MRNKFSVRVISMILAMALIVTMVQIPAMAASAGAAGITVADPGTADAWEDIMGTDADGNRYAGRVWVDKSVYTDGAVVTLNGDGTANSQFTVDVDRDRGEFFQVVFSALGSSVSTNTKTYSARPLDVVLVLDTSTSMTTYSGGAVRLQHMIEAANDLLEELLALGDVRVAIVSFNNDSETILGLNKYDNGIVLSTNNATNTNGGGIIYAHDKENRLLGSDSGYARGTNLQDGIDRGMRILAEAANTHGRAPVAIVLADGRANHAVSESWYTPADNNVESSNDAGIILSTLLNAAYGKTRVESNYGTAMTVYGVGIDLSSTSDDYIFLDPGAEGSSGFGATNTDSSVRTAWQAFTTWRSGTTATITSGYGGYGSRWIFDHGWPASAGVTTEEIAANIHYVDNYQDVTGANLGAAFDNILQELSVGAFNPISTSTQGATGVEDTPLIYVDNIGRYMQVREVQAIQVFGRVFAVNQNSDGTYSVEAGSGINPTTNENWSTAGDIDINLLYNADGTQQLRIYIEQEILPILLDKISVTTENGSTSMTIEELRYPPLRVFYTVGIDESILLPNGEVDPQAIDSDYPFLNANGTADFYSNAFGVMSTGDADGDGLVDKGDAHVGFVPSGENRYYYHQAHQEIFISATNADGSDIVWDDDMYGVRWNESDYLLEAMTYADLNTVQDGDRVYTYVTFIRPTGVGTQAEQVTYLVYTTWGDLKSSITYHDKVNNANLNGGRAIGTDELDTAASSYLSANAGVGKEDLIAILGMGSRRVSRLHNMYETKSANTTGTAETAYAPAYNDSAADVDDLHEHSEVIVWLGNNGKLTLPVAAGIRITKAVTELADGAAADEAFEIRVLLRDVEYTAENVAALFLTEAGGAELSSSKYTVTESGGDILITLYLADGESANVMGVADGTVFEVTEAEHEKYTFSYSGATQAQAGEIVEGVVTNTPVLPGSLYITKEVVPYREGEPFPEDAEFTFEVTFLDKNGEPIKNTKFRLENNYDPSITERETDAAGVMTGWLRHGETVHILDVPDGATVTVKEAVLPAGGNYTLTGYRSRDYSGDTADNDGTVTVSSGHNATVVVTNTYTPKPVTVELDLSIEKTLRVDTPPDGDRYFAFALESRNGTGWTPMKSYDPVGWTASEVLPNTDNVKTHREASPVLLGSFTEAGTYNYRIYEILPDVRVAGMTYDRTVHTLTVTVADVNGQLVATAVDQNGRSVTDTDLDGDLDFAASFLNEENSATVSIDISKQVEDTSDNPEISRAGFEFVAQTATVDAGVWSPKPASEGGRSFSVRSDGAGEARMIDQYKTEGTYYYIISEVDGGKAGWSYSGVQYRVTVTVTKAAGSNDLKAEMSIEAVNGTAAEVASVTEGTRGRVVFANTYDPDDAVLALDPLVEKELKGRDMQVGEFTFAIFENGRAELDADGNLTNLSQALAVGTNDANGKVAFTPDTLSFSRVGKYEFDILEVKGTGGGISYDPVIYDLVAEVSDVGGRLEANYYFEDAVGKTVIFTNTYDVERAEVVIRGVKSLTVNRGTKTLQEGEFTFALYDAGGTELGRTANLADGSFRFAPIGYGLEDAGKSYTYTVKEVAPDGSTDGSYSENGVTWSGQSFAVTVGITDNGDGTLRTDVSGNGPERVRFVNTYTSTPVNVVISGQKNLENRSLEAGEFTFSLYGADSTFGALTLIKKDITHDVNGQFSVELGTLGEGRHYFLIKENLPATPEKGIHYSVAEFRITVVVTDHGTGSMSYTQSIVNPGAPAESHESVTFTNVYSPEPGELALYGSKIYSGGRALVEGMFSVGLYDGEGGLVQTAPIKADGSFAFESLTYHAADVGKSFAYTVREIIPDGATDNGDGTYTLANDVYDGSVYALAVSVSDDDKDGALEISASLTKNGAAASEITFTNRYVPDDLAYTIRAKKTYNKTLLGNDFDFVLHSADSLTAVNQSKKNDVDGNVVFDPIIFRAPGTYSFTVKEINKVLGFINYSAAEYDVTVTVEQENGILRVAHVSIDNRSNSGETDLEFINAYVLDGEGEITLRGTKKLIGDRTQLKEDEFEFGLYSAGGELIESVRNGADGGFAFSTLRYGSGDVPIDGYRQISYTVRELKGTDVRVSYDETVYSVVVTVADNGRGGVTVSYTVNGDANGAITFTNRYTAAPEDITVGLDVIKTVVNKGGDSIGPEGFEFLLSAVSDGAEDRTAVSDANGRAGFSLTFSEEDVNRTYVYKLTEINDGRENVSYSTATHTVTVSVSLNGDNELVASLTLNGESTDAVLAEFENVYEHTSPQPLPPILDTPHTGDDTNLHLWFILLVASGSGLLGAALYGRKRKQQDEQ